MILGDFKKMNKYGYIYIHIYIYIEGATHNPFDSTSASPLSGCPRLHLEPRLSLPSKPVLSVANLGGKHDYPELGSKYKASHVKILIHWVTVQSQNFAGQNPRDPGTKVGTVFLVGLKFHMMWGRNSFVWTSFGIFKAYRPTQLEVLFLSHAAAKPTNGDHLSLGCRGYAAIPWAQDMELQTFSTTCYNLQRCIEVMDNGGLVLNGNDAQEASNCLKMFLSGYAWLASHFLGQRLMLFLMRPKHHCLYHQAV